MRVFVSINQLSVAAALTLGLVLPVVALAQPVNSTRTEAIEAVKQVHAQTMPAHLPMGVRALDLNLVLGRGDLGEVRLADVLTSLQESTQPNDQVLVLGDERRLQDLVSSIYANRWLASKGQQLLKDQVSEPPGPAPSELTRNRFWAEAYMRHEVVQSLPEAQVITKLAASARVANPAMYTVAGDKKVRHVLLVSRNAPNAEVEAKAQQVLAQLNAGADFAELAKSISQDTRSAAAGGDLGWVMNENYPLEFKDAVAKLNDVGARSEVFRTDFGYHIVQLDEIRPSRLMTDEEAAVVMREQLIQARNKDVRQRLWQEARAHGSLNEANVLKVVQAANAPQ